MEAKTDPSSVGCVAGFVHKVKVCEDAVPVQQKLWRLPFAVRQAVSDKLCLKEGIIERIDTSPWISPIMVTTRKGGRIRLCVDLILSRIRPSLLRITRCPTWRSF